MDYRIIKHTDLKVSRLCFGTMTFGKPLDQDGATKMIDRCADVGINFIDTANAYQRGHSEVLLGHALRGRRDKFILASKVEHKMGDGPDDSGLSKKAIFKAIDDSLKRLQTDYLDFYFLHQPDYQVPIEETMEAMDSLVRQGKIRYMATSNYASWQVAQMFSIAEKQKYAVPCAAQTMYSLIARGIEQEFIFMAKEFGVSIIAYNPLAAGLLTGKHDFQNVAPGTRFDSNPLYQGRYWHAQDFAAIEQLKKIAADEGRSMISMSLNWLLYHTTSDCVILGASRLEQLDQNLAACEEGPLSDAAVEACNRVWLEFRGPSPVYNR